MIPADPGRGSSVLLRLGLSFLLLFVLLVAGLAYAQSRHGFRHAVVPLVASLTGVKVEVRDGRLSLLGGLEAEGLIYEDQAAGLSVEAERVALTAMPWSFMKEGVFRIDDCEVKQAKLRILLDGATDDASIHPPAVPMKSRRTILPLAVMRARFQDVTFMIETADSRITGMMGAAIDNLGPGRTGSVDLKTHFAVMRAGEPALLSAALELAFSVAAGPSGMPITWKGTNQALLRDGGDGAIEQADADTMVFDQTVEGEWQASQSLRLFSTITAHKQDRPLGSAAVTAAINTAEHPVMTDLTLTITDLAAETIHLLWRTPAARFSGGRFNAGIEARLGGPHTSVRGTITGSQVQLRVEDREVSPPVDVSFKHAGAFDSAAKTLSIEMLSMTINDRARPMLSAALDHPVSLRSFAAGQEPAPSGLPATPAILSLQLFPTRPHALRPWLALFGAQTLTGVEEGMWRGAVTATVHEQGSLIDMAGQVEARDVMLKSERRGRASSLGRLHIVTDWKAQINGLHTLRLDPLTTTVRVKDRQVAALRMAGTARITGKRAVNDMQGTLTLENLPGEALNPLLASWGSARIAQARFDGHAELVMDTRQARWEVDLHGQHVQLRLPDAVDEVPQLDMMSQLDAAFDRITEDLRVDRLNVRVMDRRHPLISLTLSQPLLMKRAPGSGAVHGPAAPGFEPIAFALRVDRLNLRQLRPWVVLAGGPTVAVIRDGALDADLAITLRDVNHVTLDGRSDLRQLTWDGASAPISVRTTIRGSLIDRSRLAVDAAEAQVLDGTIVLGRLQAAGSAGSAGPIDLRLELAAERPIDFLGRFGLLADRQQTLWSKGRLQADVRLTAPDRSGPLTVKADLRSTDLTLRVDTTRQLTNTVRLEGDIEVDAARTMADIRLVRLTGESNGASIGTVTASGRWPVATRQAGAIALMIKEWDSGPVMDFLEFLPGRMPGPLPVTADLTISREDTILSLRGKEVIGPMRVALNGRPSEPATLELQHDVILNDEEIILRAFALASNRTVGQKDRLSVSGRIRTGSRPRVDLRGAIDALNADWYAALAAPESPSSPGRSEGANGAGPPVPLDLELDLGIGDVLYRTLHIGAGRLIAKGDGRRMEARLEPTGLAKGTVQGTVTVSTNTTAPEYAWNLAGNELDLGVLTNAGFVGPELRMTGRGLVRSTGTGHGRDETLRHSLNGMVSFDVTDGQFTNAPVLEFLADQTKIEEFRGFGFRTLHGALEVKDGWVTIQEFRAIGAVVGIEAGGKLALDGRLDMRVEPKIGPAVSQHVRIPCLDQLAKTAEGFTVLPIAVTVTGTVEAHSYGVTAAGLQRREGILGSLKDFVKGCRTGEAAHNKTKQPDSVKDSAQGLIDLLGESQKR